MIRVAAIVSLAAVLVLALYLPSAFPPERFLVQLKAEHAATTELWGQEAASRLLDLALSLQDTTRQLTPGVAPAAYATGRTFDTAVAREMTTVGQRLLDNAYLRSIEALLLLALYRLGIIGHALPWLMPFTVAAFADGQVSRLLKAREFRRHDPEMYALATAAAIVVGCGTFVALLLPVSIPALLWPIAPLGVGLLLARAFACFHLRA